MSSDYIFVEQIENTFGIKIPAEQLELITTPRQLVDYLCTQLPMTAHTHCVTQQAFYKLRRFFLLRSGFSRKQLIPKILLTDLMPLSERSVIWQELNKIYGLDNWPDLERPKAIKDNILGLFLLMPLIITLFIWSYYPALPIAILIVNFLAMAVLVMIIGLRLTSQYQNQFPDGLKTLGDLAYLTAITNTPREPKPDSSWTRTEIKLTIWRLLLDDTYDLCFDENRDIIDLIGE